VPIAAVDSPPLRAIVRWMDRTSDNFEAEMLLKQLGAVQAERGTTSAGIGVVSGLLAQAGVPTAGVRMVDGSGLSLLDRFTANALVSLLTVMWNDPGVRPEPARIAAGRRTQRHARPSHARDRRCRRRAREDGDDEQRVRALRVRRRPLRLLDSAERLADLMVLGPPRTGPVRRRASRVSVI